MKSRQLTALIAVGLLVSSVPAVAQNPSRSYRVGLLSPGPPLTEASPYGKGLVRGFAQDGYVVGRNITFERRNAELQMDRLPRLAEELVASKVDLIVATGHLAASAAKRVTSTIPVVVLGAGDIVDSGLVDSLARPGGNMTGISEAAPELSTKRLELLKEAAPGVRRVAMVWNAGDVAMTQRYQAAAAAALALGLVVQPFGVRGSEDFDGSFAAMTRDLPDAILMVSDVLTAVNLKRVLGFADSHKLPAIYEYDRYVRDGGLMSYGPDQVELAERAAKLAIHILKGTKPADLPVEEPTQYRLVINLKAAKVLDLAIPPSLLARADEVIE